MKTLHLRFFIVFLMCFYTLVGLAQNTPVSYKIAYDQSTAKYTVYMKTTTAFVASGSPSSQISTSQVSVVVPHGMFPNLTVSGGGVTSINGTWSLNTRLDQPSSISKDYLFFAYSSSPKFAMPANTDIPLFSFSSTNCISSVALYDITTDPLQVPNAENANPGNSITILGNGGDAYSTNYGGATTCVVATSPDLTTMLGAIPPLTVGVTSNIPVTVANIGTAPAPGPISTTVTIPTGITPPSAPFTSNGWSCATLGQNVTCTNPGPITNGTSSIFNVPITPTGSSVGTSPVFTAITTPVSGETIIPNNTSPPASPVAPVAAAPAPDLTTTVGAIPTLTAGLTSNIPVTVSNIGTAPASGPISTTVTIPSGITPPSAPFTSNGWSCSTSGQTVTCTNPNPITNGSSSVFNVPVTPTNSSVGTTPQFTATTTPVSGETVTNNNTGNASATTPIQAGTAPDLVTAVGPVPTLVAGVTSNIPVTVSNIGTAPASGPIMTTLTIPTSITPPFAPFTSNGWSCTTSGQTVTCTNPNSLTNGASSIFNVPITPTNASIGTIPSLVVTTTPVSGEVITSNNGSTGSPTVPVQAGTAPDLVTTVGPIPALTAGVTSNIPVTVSNIGTAPASGPITTTVAIPAGITPPSAPFTSNGWSCTTSGQNVTCTNPNAITNGASSLFNVPITPTNAVVGSLPSVSANTTPVSGEVVTSNNGGANSATTQVAASSTTCTNAIDCGQGIRYGLKLGSDGMTYTVYMKSATAYSGNFAMISTAQATVVLPTGTQISNPTGLQAGMVWVANTRIDHPSENTAADYVSFGFSQSASPAVFNIPAETEIPLFSFQRTGPCIGNLKLMDTAELFQGVSTSTNPGNQVTVVGNGITNAWQCNYTCPVACPTSILSIVKTSSTSTIYQNTPFDYNFTITNTGTSATVGTVTVTDVLPAGLQYVSSAGAGWSCSAVGQTVTCTCTTAISVGSANSKTLSIKVNPTQLGAISNSASVSGGGAVGTVSSAPCATCPIGATISTILTNPVDLTIAIAQPGSLTVGQATTVNVTVSNISSGTTPGSVSASLSFSNGVTAPASFNGGNNWTCTTVLNQVTCTNPSALGGNQNSVISIPITPTVSNAGQSLLLLANVASVVGESNLSNNSAFIFTNSLVRASDLTVTAGPVPALLPNQTSLLPITINNIGQASATGPVTIQVTLPAGVALNNSQLPSGWTLSNSVAGPNGTTIVSLTNSNVSGIASSGSLTMNLPIIPASNTSGSVTFGVAVNPISSESNTLNNSTSVSGTVGATDLAISVTAPSSSVVGQTTNLAVTVSNVGTAATTGSLSVQATLPSGVTLNSAALLSGWVLQSSTTNLNGSTTIVVVNNSTTLQPTGQVTFNLPVVLGASNANQVTNIVLNVLQVAGETNTSNNQTNVSLTPTAPQISVVVTPPVSVTGGQPSNYTINFTNTGNAPYTGPITTQVTIPSGVTLGPLPSGWVIQSQTTNPNGNITYVFGNPSVSLPVGGSIGLVIPFTPSTTLNGQNISIVVVTPTIPGYSTPTTTQTSTLTVIAPSSPYITIAVGNPTPTLTVGQNSIIPITFTNIGNITSLAPLNVQLTLPAGVVLNQSQLPAGWFVSSSASGPNGSTVYTLTNNSSTISPNGGQLILNVPVFVNQGATGTTPSIIVNVTGQPTGGSVTYVTQQPITAPNIVVNIGQPSPNLVVGQTSIIPITVSNTGNGTGYGPISAQVTLPVGVTLGTMPSGWTLASSVTNLNGTTTITITNPNLSGLAPNASITANLAITPGSSTLNTTPTFSVVVAPFGGFTNPISQTMTVNMAVQTPAPDLTVVLSQPSPSLVAGQTSNVGVLISNVGNLAVSGALSVQITLPSGVALSPSQLPVGWILQTQTTNGNGSITYTLQNSSVNIPAGQSINFNVPVTPNSSTINTNPTISVSVVPVSGEVVINNNTGSVTVNISVQSPPSAPDLAIVIPAQSWTLQTGQTTNVTFNVINIGSQSAGSPLAVTFTLPANFTTNPTSFSTNGWSCSTSGTQVSCNIAGGLNVGSQATLVIPVMPMSSAANMVNPSFVINVAQASGEVSLVNNTGIINYVGTVQSLVPDLAVSLPSQSWSLIAGQTANVTFNVSNIGTATATAPLSLSFTMPANFGTSPSTFTTNGWSCSTNGSVVTCSSSSSMAVGATTSLVIPVQPLSAAAGLVNPSFVINVIAASGETVLANNTATINYSGTVQAGNLLLNVKAILQGSYDATSGLMRDDLRSKNLIPSLQPYTSTPGVPAYTFINSGTETVSSTILAVTGNNAIVDWVMVELRSSSNPAQILASKPALIQRDGDIVSNVDGTSPVSFTGISAGSYYVVARHRNHLGVMSATPIALSSTAVTTDLTAMANLYKVSSYGNYPAIVSGTKALMWAGNTSGDANVIFQGPNTDVDGSFFTIITDVNNTGLVTNFINSGYRMSDVNMDGKTIFQGPNNEPDIIFFNVILHPENTGLLSNFIIRQHLPQ